MIIDHLLNFEAYGYLSPGIAEGLKFISAVNSDIPVGRHNIIDGVTAIVSEYQTKPPEGSRYETHKKAIDIQCLIRGREIIRWLPMESLIPATEYDAEKDIRFYSATVKGTDLILNKGLFVIFFPEDGHCPGLSIDVGPETVKKVVVKVEI